MAVEFRFDTCDCVCAMTPAFGYRVDSSTQWEDADADRKKRRGGSCGESRYNLVKTSESALERAPLLAPL
jgi:hypothetical protein